MNSIETAILIPLILLLVLTQFAGLVFFFVAQLRTGEALETFFEASGTELFERASVDGLKPGPASGADSFEQLRTRAWIFFRWGLAASDLTQEVAGHWKGSAT